MPPRFSFARSCEYLKLSYDTCYELTGACDRWTELMELWTRVMKQLQKDQLFVELYRVYLSIIIVHLFRNDYVAADRAYSQFVAYVPAITKFGNN